jgi:type IV pilus assembly protein PilO
MRFGIRELIFLLLLLAMPVASCFFVFQPRTRQMHEAQDEMVKKRLKLRELRAATRRFEDLGVQIEKLTAAIEMFEQKLPARREEQVVLQQVWELAARNDLVPQSIRPGKPVPSAHYAELPISLAIKGNFDGFYRFMLDLEKLSRITRMPRLEFVQLPQTQGDVAVLMTLSVFFEAQGDDGRGGPSQRSRL